MSDTITRRECPVCGDQVHGLMPHTHARTEDETLPVAPVMRTYVAVDALLAKLAELDLDVESPTTRVSRAYKWALVDVRAAIEAVS